MSRSRPVSTRRSDERDSKGGAAVTSRPRPDPWRGLLWLSARECIRVIKLWTQTMLAPVVSSLLFILVFGLSLSTRIREVAGVEYVVFIVPGLIAMAMAQAAYSNNSSSIFQARSDRYLNDVLAAPMRPWQMHIGLSVGGAFRSIVIGIALVALAVPLTGAPLARIPALALAIVLLVILFGALGVIVGVYAETFDHHTFVNNILILPLTFVGGVFYPIDILPSPWAEISHANPLFYVVNSVRYGFLGQSDVSVVLSFSVTAVMALVMVFWAQWLFTTGRRLKP